MELSEIEEIIEVLPKDKTRYFYFKDKYAIDLIQYLMYKGLSIGELKKSSKRNLLQKQNVKEALSKLGKGKLKKGNYLNYWPDNYLCYLLTLGIWGDGKRSYRNWHQMSRTGHHLVLQMNFTSSHNEQFFKLIRRKNRATFAWEGHPIARTPYQTMAWARIDLNLNSGEALIEEIQNDWLRRAVSTAKYVGELKSLRYNSILNEMYGSLENAKKCYQYYLENVLSKHLRLWDEAMLSAVLWFLINELGMNKIYYHTFNGGNLLKGLKENKPPKSLYTSLPKRFCFEETESYPQFIENEVEKLRKKNKLNFYELKF